MAGYIPNPEKDYPVAVMRESIPVGFMGTVVGNGTDVPSLSAREFIPLFVAGSKGAILDFVNFRYETGPQDTGDDCTIRYVADGAAMANNGTALTNTLLCESGSETDWRAFTTVATANKIPPYALVYADISNADSALASPGLYGAVFDVGHRVLTN